MNNNTTSQKLTYTAFNEDVLYNPLWQASTYVTGNTRILSHQSIDSSIHSISHQYGFDKQTMKSVYYSADIQSSCSSACWFELLTDSGELIDMRSMQYPHQTGYQGGVSPQTLIKTTDFDISIDSIAPISRKGDVPLFHSVKSQIVYGISITNTTDAEIATEARLRLGGKVFAVKGGSDEWWEKDCRYSHPKDVSYIQCNNDDLPTMTILFDNETVYCKSEIPYLKKRTIIAPGESCNMNVTLCFDEEPEQLCTDSTDSTDSTENLSKATLDFWNQIIGSYSFYQKEAVNDFLFRAALESFLCVRTSRKGEVIGIANSVAPLTETVDCSGVLLQTMPILELYPSLYTSIIQWLVRTISSPEWTDFENLTVFVSPAVMVGLLYRRYGSAAIDDISDDVIRLIDRLMTEAVLPQKATCGIYATEKIFGYTPVTKYELGTNIKCYSAFLHWRYICNYRKMPMQSAKWAVYADELFEAIQSEFLSTVFSESNLQYAGLKFVAEYRLNALHYYEFDGLDIAAAPIFGFCSYDDKTWKNTISHMFSPLYQLLLAREETPLWWERSNQRKYLHKQSDPTIIAKLFAEDSRKVIEETLANLMNRIDVCGSIWQMEKHQKVLRSARLSGMAYTAITQNCFGVCSNGLEQKALVNNRPVCRIKQFSHGKFAANQLDISSNIGITKQALKLTNNSSEQWNVSANFYCYNTLDVEQILVDGSQCSSYFVQDINSAEKTVRVDFAIDGNQTVVVSVLFKRVCHERSDKLAYKLKFEEIN